MRDDWTILEKAAWVAPFTFYGLIAVGDLRLHGPQRIAFVESLLNAFLSGWSLFPEPGQSSWIEILAGLAAAMAAALAWRALRLNLEDRRARDRPQLRLAGGTVYVRDMFSNALRFGYTPHRPEQLFNVGLGPATQILIRYSISGLWHPQVQKFQEPASNLVQGDDANAIAGSVSVAAVAPGQSVDGSLVPEDLLHFIAARLQTRYPRGAQADLLQQPQEDPNQPYVFRVNRWEFWAEGSISLSYSDRSGGKASQAVDHCTYTLRGEVVAEHRRTNTHIMGSHRHMEALLEASYA